MKKIIFCLLLCLCVSCSNDFVETRFATIGTGGMTGIYYPVGEALAEIVNGEENPTVRLSVESTAGSVFNIKNILAREYDLGIAQSDVQYEAYNGKGVWSESGEQKELRSICSLYPEILTLTVNSGKKINAISDLKGKRINIGNKGSGGRQNALNLLENSNLHWDFNKEINISELQLSESPYLMQTDKIDGFFFTSGHPANIYKEVSASKIKAAFVPLTVSNDFLKKYSYYAKAYIPIKYYPEFTNKKDIESFGVKATLVTSIHTPEKVVYDITKKIFQNISKLRKKHPVLENISKESMLEALSAPMHDGAVKYYKEIGLIK